MSHESKYSLIITDPEAQAVNPDMEQHLTVEQYYDLLHHTHAASDIVGGSGSIEGDIDSLTQSIKELTDKLNNDTISSEKLDEIKTSIQELSDKIEENFKKDAEHVDNTGTDLTELKELLAQNSNNDAEIAASVQTNAENIATLLAAVQANTEAVNAQVQAIEKLKTTVENLADVVQGHSDYISQDISYGDNPEP